MDGECFMTGRSCVNKPTLVSVHAGVAVLNMALQDGEKKRALPRLAFMNAIREHREMEGIHEDEETQTEGNHEEEETEPGIDEDASDEEEMEDIYEDKEAEGMD